MSDKSKLEFTRPLRLRGAMLFLGAACLVLALAGPAAAEEKTVKTGEITVSASKIDTEVDKMPTNIAIISREEIERYPGNYSIFDVLREANVPGIYIPSSAYGIDEDGLMSTRGGEVNGMGMRVMVNGIEFNKGNGYVVPPRLALHDVERVEIIKTPSSEYGDLANGGVLNIVTRVASRPAEGKAGVGFTTFGGGNGYAVLNGSQGKFEYIIDASMKRQDAYQDRTYMKDNNVYTRIAYNLTKNATVAFHGAYFDTDSNYANGMTKAQFDADPKQNPGADNTLKETEKMAAFTYDQHFGPHLLKVKLEFKDDLTEMFWYGWNRFDEWETHPEANFTFNHNIWGMANKLVVGGEYRYHTMHTTLNEAPNNNIGKLTGDRERKDTTWAGYVQDELGITEDFTVTAGLRYDNYEQDQVGKINPAANTWNQSNGAFSPKIGATYTFCEGLNVFAGYNTGFKSPARVGAAATSGNLDPERIYAYEAGMRGKPLPWLDYNLAFYWNEVHDKFVKPSTEPDAQYDNAGKTRSRGVEVGVNTRFANGLYASGSFTYQEAKFTDFTSLGVNYDGKYLNGVPDMMFSVYAGYRNRLWGDISLNPVYTGKRYFNYANTLEEDGFWVLNARYIKRFDNWKPGLELYVAANNILDQKAYGSASGSPGRETIYPYPGFNVMVGVNAWF